MASILDSYTLEQAETDIATLRGQVQLMGEYLAVGSVVIDARAGSNGTGEITIDTWHSFTPGNSWTVPTGGFAQYRLTPTNELQISAQLNGPSGSTVNGVTIVTFPAAYRPVSTHWFPVTTNLYPSSNTSTPRMSIDSTGALQAQGVGGNPGSAFVNFEIRIPLDI